MSNVWGDLINVRCPHCQGSLFKGQLRKRQIAKCLMCSREFDPETMKQEELPEWLKVTLKR